MILASAILLREKEAGRWRTSAVVIPLATVGLIFVSVFTDPRLIRYDLPALSIIFGAIAGGGLAVVRIRKDGHATPPEEPSPADQPREIISVGWVSAIVGLSLALAGMALFLQTGIAADGWQALWIALVLFFGMSSVGLAWNSRLLRGFAPAGWVGVGLFGMGILLPLALLVMPPLEAYRILEPTSLGWLAGYPLMLVLGVVSFALPFLFPGRRSAQARLALSHLSVASAGFACAMLGLALHLMALILAGGIAAGGTLGLAVRALEGIGLDGLFRRVGDQTRSG